MKLRRKHWIMLVLLLAAVAALFLRQQSTMTQVGAGSEMIREQTDDYKIEIEYPVVGISSADRDMQAAVDDMLAAFKRDISENRAGDPEMPPGDLTGRFNRSVYGDHIASYILDTYIYTGGAHGNVVYISRTYDWKTGARITLDDLFADTSAALAKVMPMAKQQLMDATLETTGEATEPDMSGLAPNADNYGVFTIDAAGITFYFAPYQVYAYAAGPQRVMIPWGSIQTHLRSQWVPTNKTTAE